MTALATTDDLFFALIDREAAERHLRDATDGCEDGELFLEYRESEAISIDDGRIRSASYDATRGFGLRAVSGEAAGYAHAGEISDAALGRAAEDREGGAPGPFGQHGGRPARAPMRASMPTPIR